MQQNKDPWPYLVAVIVICLLLLGYGIAKLWATQSQFHDWRCTVHLIECRKVSP